MKQPILPILKTSARIPLEERSVLSEYSGLIGSTSTDANGSTKAGEKGIKNL